MTVDFFSAQFDRLGNAKFITHTICEHMTNVPLPLPLLQQRLLFHSYSTDGMTLGCCFFVDHRCTLLSCKFETVNQHNFCFCLLSCVLAAYFYINFDHNLTMKQNTPVWKMHILSTHILQCVSVVVIQSVCCRWFFLYLK